MGARKKTVFYNIYSHFQLIIQQLSIIKDRNSMNLTEAEGIKKRWQEYTEELYKKDPHDPGNHDNVITRARLPRMQSQVGLRKHHYG